MQHIRNLGAAAAAILMLSGCAPSEGALGEASSEAADVEAIAGTDLSTVTLSAAAYERLGIKTAPVRSSARGTTSAGLRVLPLAAMLYDAEGNTWVFTTTEDRVFVRAAITLHHVEGELAYLEAGPAVGISVVTVGAAQLWGAELGVGGE